MTLSIAQHWLGIADQCKFLRVLKNKFLPLFPRLVTQGQFNRRARNLCWLIHALRQHLVAQRGIQATTCHLIDGTPVHLRHLNLRHWRRFGKGHLLLPEASLGFCASKKETYYGFRLMALTTPDGMVVSWDLFTASTDERECAQVKGTIGLERPGARTIWGTLSRLIAKMTGLTLAAKCNREQGHSPLRLAEFSF
jgi:hypothetical protein